MEDSNINETWLWTKVPIYFVQPPTVFQFTSLLFNHHNLSRQTYELMIILPSACLSDTSSLSCYDQSRDTTHINNKYLDVLTNEVSCILY